MKPTFGKYMPRIEDTQKTRLWAIEHPRRKPENVDEESWLGAVRGWLGRHRDG